jgi:molybdate transport system substrate-binding protein
MRYIAITGVTVVILAAFAALYWYWAGSGSGNREPGRHIVAVAAAADLRFALDEVAAEFQKACPDIQLQITYGSSGNFLQQLENRAPFDVFLSADVEYPRRLATDGLADPKSEFVYAVGHLVLWVTRESGLDLDKTGIRALLAPSVQKIAIANPKYAPYGRAAEAALKSLSVYEDVRERLVLGDNVAQAAQFVHSGAADIGIIGLSQALAPTMRSAGRYWEVPASAYPRMQQGGIILSWAKDREAADAFCDFLLGAEGRAILNRYGFSLPED